MSDIRTILTNELKNAMRSGDSFRKDVIRNAQAAVKQIEIDERITLDDAGILKVLQKEIKSQREVIADAEKAARPDLVDEAERKIAVLQEFLPKQLSEEEITALVRPIVQELGGSPVMGDVMKKLLPQVQGKADGKLVSQVVQKVLKNG
ncbi:MAG TPA: GatB/YqeY domain-containing protein [Anaerolineales bacterium]|nr:GatB/YqeY domain-containing protein [Anaerolineales bacterium]